MCNFISFYHSPSQKADSFGSCLEDLKLNLHTMNGNNPFIMVMIGDFNARSSSLCLNDKSNSEWTKIDCLVTQYDIKQVINQPTDLLQNSSSWTDLVYISQSNLVMDAGVHSSLHESFHDQIVYPKFNTKIHYRSPYKREVWHFQKFYLKNGERI